jgi:hypothetical protein
MTGEIKRKLKGREAKNTQTSKRAPPREQVPLPVPDLGAAGSGLRFQRCVSVFGLVLSHKSQKPWEIRRDPALLFSQTDAAMARRWRPSYILLRERELTQKGRGIGMA